jgi:hypothetical protein
MVKVESGFAKVFLDIGISFASGFVSGEEGCACYGERLGA